MKFGRRSKETPVWGMGICPFPLHPLTSVLAFLPLQAVDRCLSHVVCTIYRRSLRLEGSPLTHPPEGEHIVSQKRVDGANLPGIVTEPALTVLRTLGSAWRRAGVCHLRVTAFVLSSPGRTAQDTDGRWTGAGDVTPQNNAVGWGVGR